VTTGPEVWREFAHDPRSPEFAPMRASDADRDIVLRALGDAYAEGRLDRSEYDERADAVHAAKTLGELPGMLDDLVPTSALVPHLGVLDTRTVEEQAIARWERTRREAFMAFLIPTLICWVVWLLTTGPSGFMWPVFPMIGTAVPLMGTMVQKKDMIESNKRRIVRKHEKDLRRQQRKQLPPPPEQR
jgi:hypothetical protein